MARDEFGNRLDPHPRPDSPRRVGERLEQYENRVRRERGQMIAYESQEEEEIFLEETTLP